MMGLQRLMLMQMMMVFGEILAATNHAVAAGQLALPGCPDHCGKVSIPYPFGTREGCYHTESLRITCNETLPSGPRALIYNSKITVINISLEGQLYILNRVARACYNKSGMPIIQSRYFPKLRLPEYSYIISNTQNKFTVVGCDSTGTVQDYFGRYVTGCTSRCGSVDYVPNGTCSGIGCCQTSIPEGVNYSSLIASSFNNHRGIWNFNNCSFAFIVETAAFNFSSNNLTNLEKIQQLPMVVDWKISNDTCDGAKHKPDYACRYNKSECYQPPGIRYGYRCRCLKGYEGNPYISKGCKDINECNNATLSQCVRTATCKNKEGNFTCSCPKGYSGDGRKDGKGCTPDQSRLIKIVAGVAAAVIALLVCSSWLYLRYKKKKLELKAKFFEQNGGLRLKETLSKRGGATETIKIFKSEELEKATTNYARSTMIGRGGFGTVYRGNLDNGRTVAIKKSKLVDQSLIDQYIREVVVLSQINHKNVVKLLGCCLETEVPLLVYEFITNGTLFNHLHDQSKPSIIRWTDRLMIATETADVLSYLHSSASDSIIHGDVKSANILLDDNKVAKVTDFGSSRFVAPELDQLSTMVQGTRGYLDPEYLQTNKLTTKSDVYSFGVVLAELLTGMKAYSPDRPEEERYLAMYFLSSLEKDRLSEIIDQKCIVLKEGNTEQQQIKEVAVLAKRCLSVKGEERPTMTEVLEGLRMTGRVASRD